MQPVNMPQGNWLYSVTFQEVFQLSRRRSRLQRNAALSCSSSRYFPKGCLPFSAPVRLLSESPLIMHTGRSSFSCRSIGECPPPKVFCCCSRAALTQFSILTSTHFLPFHQCTRNWRVLFVSQLKPPHTRVSTSSPLHFLGRRL